MDTFSDSFPFQNKSQLYFSEVIFILKRKTTFMMPSWCLFCFQGIKLWCSMSHNVHFVLCTSHCWLISHIFWLDDCIITKKLVACVCACVCVCLYVWVSDIARASQQVPSLLIPTIYSVKTCWGRAGSSESAKGNVWERPLLISAFQPVLLGILATISHQANATVIQFVRLYSKKAKDIWA